MMSKWITIAALGVGVLTVPAFGQNAGRPGTLNYVEGAAFIDGQQLGPKEIGDIDLNPGQVLSTANGKAEILLTPGVFLRLDGNSAVKMISPDLTKTQLELEHGRAAVEVDEIYPQNDLEIVDAGVTTQLAKTGYYEFNADNPTVMVFKGKAAVEVSDGKYKVLNDHHEFMLAQGGTGKPLAAKKAVNFNTQGAEDELYNWNILRSQYLAEANNQIAGTYAGVSGFNPGWYWDPYMWNYTFIGMGPYWSPFGFGFYPPWGWYGGYWRGGFYGGRSYGRAGEIARGGFAGGGVRGGGFGGGGGGFHGGGGGGGHR
jgi:hypothetical protein